MQIKGIKYISPLFDNSGYAKASRGNILALHKAGVPLTLSPVSFERLRPNLGEDGNILNSLVEKDIDYNIVITHLTPEFWEKHYEPGKFNCNYTIWETDKLHPDWPKYINKSSDKVLVGSHFNIGVFQKSGVEKPIGVIPHGINMKDFDDIKPFEIGNIKKDAYVFYSIFQWTERKNPLDLIKAYWYAFQNDEKVALVLKTYRTDYTEKEKDAIRTTVKRLKQVTPIDKNPPIYLVLDMLSEAEIHGLHARGDCYTSFDRGEGFGLCPFTAGACGNPVIATGWGGATEYLNHGTGYPINYTLEPVFGMPWSPWYRGDQLWAKPDVEDGINKMRYVYEHQDEAKERGDNMREYIAENFSWKNIASYIIRELEVV